MSEYRGPRIPGMDIRTYQLGMLANGNDNPIIYGVRIHTIKQTSINITY